MTDQPTPKLSLPSRDLAEAIAAHLEEELVEADFKREQLAEIRQDLANDVFPDRDVYREYSRPPVDIVAPVDIAPVDI